ncbi:MAG: DUF1289 domain-containing protein [Gammaproteobacteria bacterium]|nr:DUF1289 domain-containing protein [Gammaproteobacteria bacterium]
MSEDTNKPPSASQTRSMEGRSSRTRTGRRGPRSSGPKQFDSSVPSPCVAVCQFNGEPFCQGCYRNLDEIREWMIMSREQKMSVLDVISKRRMEDTGEQLW